MINDPSVTTRINTETPSPLDEEARLVTVFRDDIEFLREIPMFTNLEDIDLARLCQVATHRSYSRGDLLLEERQVNDTLFMVRKGFVELSSHHTSGEAFLKLGRGRFFGHVSMFDPAPSSATVTAVTNVEVICLRERPLCDLLIAYPEVGLRLMAAVVRDLARRYHTLVKRIQDANLNLQGIEDQSQ
jgi:CRP/FNR family transcriptional regulator